LDSVEIRSNKRSIEVDWRIQAFSIMIELGYSKGMFFARRDGLVCVEKIKPYRCGIPR